jgi:DNA repair exonuclease SbcCD ATPase subunit
MRLSLYSASSVGLAETRQGLVYIKPSLGRVLLSGLCKLPIDRQDNGPNFLNMTPSANQEPPKAQPPVPSQEREDAINDFFSFIGRLSDGNSYLCLKSIVLDNDILRKELDNTNTAYDRNIKELTQRTADWNAEKEKLEKRMEDQTKQCRKVTEEKATAYRKLKAEQDTATGLRAKIAALDDDGGRHIANSKKLEERITKLDNTIARQAKQLEVASKEAAMLKEKVRSTGDQLSAQSKALTAAESNLGMFRSFTATLTSLEDVRVSM